MLEVGSAPAAKATDPHDTAAAPDPCSPAALKLPAVKLMPGWGPHAGCSVRGEEKRTLVGTEADVAANFDCKGASVGVNFATSAILIVRVQLSPAQSGILALDDGTTITMVNRFRNPCPNDPRPMPTPTTLLFKLTGGARAFAEATCTVTPSCK